MPTPSEKALAIAREVLKVGTSVYINEGNIELAAGYIDTALNEARLEGVRLGLEAAAQDLEKNHLLLDGDTFKWHTDKDALADNNMRAKTLHAERLRALDPQQVINESVK
jgi:hypothetical protein